LPLTPEQTRIDGALKQVEAAQKNLSGNTNPSMTPHLQQSLNDAKTGLKSAIDAEIASREAKLPTGQKADDATLKQWGDDIAARYSHGPERQTLLRDTVTDIRTDRQVDTILAPAKAESDPKKALKLLSDGYAGASPEVRTKLLGNADVGTIIDNAVKWANEPLTRPMDSAPTTPQAFSYEAIQRLDTLTRDLDKSFAGEVVSQALPEYERFNKDFQGKYGSSMFGMNGMQTLTHVTGRIAGTPPGDSAVTRFAQIGSFNANGIRNALAEGASPAYVIEFARINKEHLQMSQVTELLREGVQMFRNQATKDLETYGKETEELQWLIRTNGSWMSDAQLQAAIDKYKVAKEAADPGWQQRVQDLEGKLAQDGTKLLEQTALLSKLPPELQGEQAGLNDFITQQLDAPEAQAAISIALQKNPSVMAGDTGIALKNFFATTKVGHEARKLAPNIANAYIKANIYDATTGIKQLDDLKGSAMAKLLGVSEGDLDKAVNQLKAALPAKGETAEQIAAKLQKLDSTVSGLKTFQNQTFAGTVFRALGVIGAGASVLNSANRVNTDPGWAADVKLFTDSSGLARSFAELSTALGRDGSLATALAGKTAGALNVFASLGDAALAIDAYQKGDGTAATMFGIAAVGGALAAAPAVVSVVPALAGSATAGSVAAWLGPIGIGLIIVGTIGNAIWNKVKLANLHQTDEAGKFLEAAGFDGETARALVDQSGDGHSPVPLLMKYGEMHGLTADQTVSWLNGLSKEQLETARDIVHFALDDFDGDVSKFNLTASNDSQYIEDAKRVPAAAGLAPVESGTQLDAVLGVWGVPQPHA
jgi:hypothetical protein